MSQLPPAPIVWSDVCDDQHSMHEALVAVFGHFLMVERNRALAMVSEHVRSAEKREQMPGLRRPPYDHIASQPPDVQAAALALCRSAVDTGLHMLMSLCAHQGFELRLKSDEVVRMRLNVEVLDADAEVLLADETINRGGEKFFGDYWGRWLNAPGT